MPSGDSFRITETREQKMKSFFDDVLHADVAIAAIKVCAERLQALDHPGMVVTIACLVAVGAWHTFWEGN
tara:strand:+ start:357 stop:566 length:210 start_codon:yes stop_codon:yes gene_type:complete